MGQGKLAGSRAKARWLARFGQVPSSKCKHRIGLWLRDSWAKAKIELPLSDRPGRFAGKGRNRDVAQWQRA